MKGEDRPCCLDMSASFSACVLSPCLSLCVGAVFKDPYQNFGNGYYNDHHFQVSFTHNTPPQHQKSLEAVTCIPSDAPIFFPAYP